MVKGCDICIHKKRIEIEEHLHKGTMDVPTIAKSYKVLVSQINYHKKKHMSTMVDEAKIILDEKSRDTGVNRILKDIEKLDLIISRAAEVLDKVTPTDIVRAMKLKAELLGDINQEEKKVEIEWINEVENEK
jgi:polysaccharide pyruvyl transferase WcaK-like protein